VYSRVLVAFINLKGAVMLEGRDAEDDLERSVKRGDSPALAELFTRNRDRLKNLVRLRLDRRLQGRFGASDVLQEAFVDAARRLPEYAADPSIPPSCGSAS
jgi:RNA polymerase sigma-70 factor (ECF subfamily)